MNFPFLDLLIWAKAKGLGRLLERRSQPEVISFRTFVNESVRQRLRLQKDQFEKPENDQRQDIFHFLCEAKIPDTNEPAYSTNELLSEANLLIIAGSDTTSAVLSGFFFYLCRNTGPYNRLVHEIRSTFKSAQEITSGPKLNSCKYLRVCIDESMRLAPSGPSELPREVRAGGLMVKGKLYPAGVEVGTAAWPMARNEEVYRDANLFRPERWIPDEATGVTEEEVARLRWGFHPFSQGRDNCVGRNLAMMEMMMVIARTLHRFDMRKAPNQSLGEGSPTLGWGQRDRHQFQLVDAYISVRDGPMVQFRKRHSA